ncbi:uncharacterized protein LOC109603606 [Aethina tumida]|uniref:uncharacterized protein LOC109603606 n=1 Tax=Aethina tumida TaxID=116153 RepID=UPI00096AF104|nr:uncharacterized protein LOC109603606 [Aethina tumida]
MHRELENNCPTLLQSCIDRVARYIESYPKDDIETLPAFIKDDLLSAITRSNCINVIDLNYLPLLFHKRTLIVNLKRLHKENVPKITDPIIMQIANCSELRELHFPPGVKCSRKVLLTLFGCVPKLEKLCMTCCSAVNEEVEEQLYMNCPKLTYFNKDPSVFDLL